MEKNEIKEIIHNNLKQAGIEYEELRVQKDPYYGWRIVVISKKFNEMPFSLRKDLVLSGIDENQIQWADLLTPEEVVFAGNLPTDVDPEMLPLWPEALARSKVDDGILFASDLDEDLDKPIVATFYSLRGGVGRSTALIYTAQILARRGLSVLCVDMDLEAPGLSSLFRIDNLIKPGSGMLSILIQLDQGESPNLLDHIIRVSSSVDLYCIPAGIPDADYARKLRLIDPETWYQYDNNPLRGFVDLVKTIPLKIDVVLIDSRTGISPISAPLLFDLSDLAIIGFYPHPQAEAGTKALVQAILRAKSRREVGGKKLTPEPRFFASPIPVRQIEKYQRRTIEWIQGWLSQSGDERIISLSEMEVSDIVHVIPYTEIIASSDHMLFEDEVLQYYENVADWIIRFIPTPSEDITSQSLPEVKPLILKELSFSTGTAELQDDFLETFVPTSVFQKASAWDRPLVIGRKGTGKTALFRWIIEKNYSAYVVMCPAAFRASYPWVLSPDGFAVIENVLNENTVGWREFWMLKSAVAIYNSMKRMGENPPLPKETLKAELQKLLINDDCSELDYVEAFSNALRLPMIGLLAWDWLCELDKNLKERSFLLFDGLDTGFANSDIERKRRKESLEGLFSFVIDREKLFKNICFKLLLREDIWNKLRFENKSHLNVRIVKLEWRSKVDYIRTVIKQALRSNQFKQLASKIIKSTALINSRVENWPDETVYEAWNLLVGERMKGGKSTYTVTWVWNRLADGNGDHSPRALFQLFSLATRWEEQEQQVNPYEKSVVRARSLIEALEEVSNQAFQSLLEEFEELRNLAHRLEEIGRSPIEAALLTDVGTDELSLAKEVGLLEVYEETDDEIRRYRVPDLYRIALGMTRKGQA